MNGGAALVVGLGIAGGVAYLLTRSKKPARRAPAPAPGPGTPPAAPAPSSPQTPPGGIPLPGGGAAPPIVLPAVAGPCLLTANPALAQQFNQLMAGVPAPPEVIDTAAGFAAQLGCLDEAAALRAEAQRRRGGSP